MKFSTKITLQPYKNNVLLYFTNKMECLLNRRRYTNHKIFISPIKRNDSTYCNCQFIITVRLWSV